jgi:diguanylate cyclase (GGDEF)-like protein/PAS domain S-box-containing protein
MSSSASKPASADSLKLLFTGLRYFSLSSLLVVAIVAAIMAMMHYQISVNAYINNVEHKNILIAQSIRALIRHHYEMLFSTDDQTADALGPVPNLSSNNDNFYDHQLQLGLPPHLEKQLPPILAHSGITKLKIFSLDGLTLYSANKAEIGDRRLIGPAFRQAAKGQPYSVLVNEEALHENLSKESEYVETYTPVFAGSDGKVVGVFEIYTDVSDEMGIIRSRRKIESGVLASLFIILFLALWISNRVTHKRDLARARMIFRVHNALKDSEAKFRSISEAAQDAIVLMDERGIVTYWNRAGEKMFGYDKEEIIGQQLHKFIVPKRYGKQYKKGIEQFRENGTGPLLNRTVEFYGLRRNCTEFPVEVSVSQVVIDDKWHAVGTIRDISDRRQSEQTLVHLATHDPLTDLPNRALLRDRLTQAIIHARQQEAIIATLFVDLDQFKLINENLGHDAGDELIQIIAARLSALVREGDTVVRFGGDAFAIILSELETQEDAEVLIKDIMQGIKSPVEIGKQQMSMTCTVGASLFPRDALDMESLVKCAEIAMHEAKMLGGNNYRFFRRGMDSGLSKKMLLRGSLQGALERGEFVLHYQPVFDLHNGNLVAAEALLRWQRANQTFVPPTEFIPIAEETGLIEPIGEWVMATVCGQAYAWQKAQLPKLRVAVNLSARQLDMSDLADMVEIVLADCRLEPQYLDLELTESLIMQNPEKAITTFIRIKEMGIGLSIDDFGTGYSSLSHLKRFPLDRVKIDRSFVRELHNDPDDKVIALTIISMAHNLRLKVVAEGVENDAQLHFLHEHGCDEVQGFYCGKPMPADDFTRLLRERLCLSDHEKIRHGSLVSASSGA